MNTTLSGWCKDKRMDASCEFSGDGWLPAFKSVVSMLNAGTGLSCTDYIFTLSVTGIDRAWKTHSHTNQFVLCQELPDGFKLDPLLDHMKQSVQERVDEANRRLSCEA